MALVNTEIRIRNILDKNEVVEPREGQVVDFKRLTIRPPGFLQAQRSVRSL